MVRLFLPKSGQNTRGTATAGHTSNTILGTDKVFPQTVLTPHAKPISPELWGSRPVVPPRTQSPNRCWPNSQLIPRDWLPVASLKSPLHLVSAGVGGCDSKAGQTDTRWPVTPSAGLGRPSAREGKTIRAAGKTHPATWPITSCSAVPAWATLQQIGHACQHGACGFLIELFRGGMGFPLRCFLGRHITREKTTWNVSLPAESSWRKDGQPSRCRLGDRSLAVIVLGNATDDCNRTYIPADDYYPDIREGRMYWNDHSTKSTVTVVKQYWIPATSFCTSRSWLQCKRQPTWNTCDCFPY